MEDGKTDANSSIEAAWQDTSSWDHRRDLTHLGDYLKHFCSGRPEQPGLAWAPTARGAPHTLMITGAALRAADLSRYVILMSY